MRSLGSRKPTRVAGRAADEKDRYTFQMIDQNELLDTLEYALAIDEETRVEFLADWRAPMDAPS